MQIYTYVNVHTDPSSCFLSPSEAIRSPPHCVRLQIVGVCFSLSLSFVLPFVPSDSLFHPLIKAKKRTELGAVDVVIIVVVDGDVIAPHSVLPYFVYIPVKF